MSEHVDKPLARRKCSCFATQHKFVGSCTACGRIMCENEGVLPTACLGCNGLVLAPMSADEAINLGYANNEQAANAYRLKDRLLVFDKEHAKRTQVFDMHADYYESATWLTAEEKEIIDAREKKRREKYNKTKRITRFNIDLTSGEVVEGDSSDSDDDSHETLSCHTISSFEYKSAENCLSSQNSKAGAVYRQLKSIQEKQLQNITVPSGLSTGERKHHKERIQQDY